MFSPDMYVYVYVYVHAHTHIFLRLKDLSQVHKALSLIPSIELLIHACIPKGAKESLAFKFKCCRDVFLFLEMYTVYNCGQSMTF